MKSYNFYESWLVNNTSETPREKENVRGLVIGCFAVLVALYVLLSFLS